MSFTVASSVLAMERHPFISFTIVAMTRQRRIIALVSFSFVWRATKGPLATPSIERAIRRLENLSPQSSGMTRPLTQANSDQASLTTSNRLWEVFGTGGESTTAATQTVRLKGRKVGVRAQGSLETYIAYTYRSI
jgi:hypothetical protein